MPNDELLAILLLVIQREEQIMNIKRGTAVPEHWTSGF
jgi:hypothetical protein